MGLSIARSGPIEGEFDAPASKPQTQRALILATLADGVSSICHPLFARETSIMMAACRSVGGEISVLESRIEIRGIGRRFDGDAPLASNPNSHYIWAGGSALVARLFLSIGAALPEAVVVDGNCNLRGRPFGPLIEAMSANGVEFRFFDAQGCLPCAVVSASLPGGNYRLGTDVSSQFITSLLISAPLARRSSFIDVLNRTYSISYLRQTIEMMSRFGITLETDDEIRRIRIPNTQCYQPAKVELTGDYTSASYILGAAFITRGDILLRNLDPASLQGEKAIIDILRTLGAKIEWIAGMNALRLDCRDLPGSVDASFDLSNCPNILPTVAAIAATMPGRIRICGGRLTQNHKSRRIDAMAAELAKSGVPASIIKSSEGFTDGLEISGKLRHDGGIRFSAYGDHRIFMATVLLALACSQPCTFDHDIDTSDSFPEFIEQLGLANLDPAAR
jgi:3-phosphoshikimate 1-carboxyvinyltransferase